MKTLSCWLNPAEPFESPCMPILFTITLLLSLPLLHLAPSFPEPYTKLTSSSTPWDWISHARLTVTATMIMMIPMMMKVMLSSRARRPSLRAPSRSPCCTLLRDCRERKERGQKKIRPQHSWSGGLFPGPSQHLSSSLQPPGSQKWLLLKNPGLKWPKPLRGAHKALASH